MSVEPSSGCRASPGHGRPRGVGGLVAGGLVAAARRRRAAGLSAVCGLVAVLGFASGCGGSGSPDAASTDAPRVDAVVADASAFYTECGFAPDTCPAPYVCYATVEGSEGGRCFIPCGESPGAQVCPGNAECGTLDVRGAPDGGAPGAQVCMGGL